jgi:hypothetical protein
MQLKDLEDLFYQQDIYIVGSGPSANLFPKEFFEGKVCISLNDAYKIHPNITPIAFMHHERYAYSKENGKTVFHPYFKNIQYPIVKLSGKERIPSDLVDWDNDHFYYFDWSHQIEDIWTMTKDTKELFYTKEGCSLHAAMQVAWILGARNIFIIGCDSTTFGGKHYANYNKDGYRDNEKLQGGAQRNYDSYIYGTMIVQEFLLRKGINVFNLSTLIGFHMVNDQYHFQNGSRNLEPVYEKVRGLS